MSSPPPSELPLPVLNGKVVDDERAAARFTEEDALSFSTFLCRAGRTALWSLHRERLCAQAEWMGLAPQIDAWERALQGGLDALSGSAAGRIALFPNGDFLLGFRPIRSYNEIGGAWMEWEPGPGDLPGWVKHGRRAHWLSAQRERGCDELLWHDSRGQVLEGVTSSIFVSDGRGLRTPPLDGRILPGIGRAAAIAGAKRLGMKVEEGPVQWTENGCWLLTSSLKGMVAVESIEGKVNQPPTQKVRELMEGLQRWQWDPDFEEEALRSFTCRA